ncbi:hypothetical protein ACSBR2_031281 [Camellia fascicularis]
MVSLTQARIDMSELDEDSDGFLQPHEMEAYIRGLIPNLAQLRDMTAAFIQMYCRIAAHKFFFFCDPHRRAAQAGCNHIQIPLSVAPIRLRGLNGGVDIEKGCIKKILLSNCLQELMELHQESEEEVTDIEQAENWFSLTSAQHICAFDEHVRHGKTGGGNAREMDFESFLDFVLALENKDTPEGLTYLFQCLDLRGRGYLTAADIHTLFW